MIKYACDKMYVEWIDDRHIFFHWKLKQNYPAKRHSPSKEGINLQRASIFYNFRKQHKIKYKYQLLKLCNMTAHDLTEKILPLEDKGHS